MVFVVQVGPCANPTALCNPFPILPCALFALLYCTHLTSYLHRTVCRVHCVACTMYAHVFWGREGALAFSGGFICTGIIDFIVIAYSGYRMYTPLAAPA